MITQPVLYVPPEIELRILAGKLFRSGSVVREVANGRIFKHLMEIAPEPQQVQEAMKGVKLNRKIVLPVVAIMAIMGGVRHTSPRGARSPSNSSIQPCASLLDLLAARMNEVEPRNRLRTIDWPRRRPRISADIRLPGCRYSPTLWPRG
ncbi:hypothetical protein [Kribbella alba]|uniref:hypothetical protein n=1 Tax=Kribbella alba TaxID=190197 RepID=UPI0031DEE404